MKPYLSLIGLSILSFAMTMTPVTAQMTVVEQTPEAYFENAEIIPWHIEPSFTDLVSYRTTILVQKEGLWGLVGENGEWIIQPTYTDVVIGSTDLPVPQNLIGVQLNNQWGFIDEQGHLVVDTKFDDVQCFTEGLAPAKENDKWGFIDMTGEWVISPQYNYTTPFSEGLARIGDPEQVIEGVNPANCGGYNPYSIDGFIDKSGKQVLSPPEGYSVRYIGDFSNGLAKVISKRDAYDTKSGYMNTEGKMVIDGCLDIGDFSDGLAGQVCFSLSEEEANAYMSACEYEYEEVNKIIIFNYIDETGKVIIPDVQTENLYDFKYGMAIVTRSNETDGSKEYGVIDKTGQLRIPFSSQQLWIIGENILATRDDYPDGSFELGMKNLQNEVLLPPVESDGLTSEHTNIILFIHREEVYVINTTNNTILGKVEGTGCSINYDSPFIGILQGDLYGTIKNPLFEQEIDEFQEQN